MDALLIATITHEFTSGRFSPIRSMWTISLAYPPINGAFEGETFLVFNTSNHDEAMDAPINLAAYLGYSADEVEIHHNY